MIDRGQRFQRDNGGPRGRLLYADRGGFAESYIYDADGRLTQVMNGVTRTIVRDGDDIIAAMNTGELLRSGVDVSPRS